MQTMDRPMLNIEKEYLSLREEILQLFRIRVQLATYSTIATGTILTIGFNVKEPHIFLLPYIILIPSMYRSFTCLYQIIKIATYQRVILEPQSTGMFKWETLQNICDSIEKRSTPLSKVDLRFSLIYFGLIFACYTLYVNFFSKNYSLDSIQIQFLWEPVLVAIFTLFVTANYLRRCLQLPSKAREMHKNWRKSYNYYLGKMDTKHLSPVILAIGGAAFSPADKEYQEIEKLGNSLAGEGYTIVSGGYLGLMQAISKGAFLAGGHTVGILTQDLDQIPPNTYLKESVKTKNMYDRCRIMFEMADIILVFKGGVGTLAEFMLLWDLEILKIIPPKPILLIGGFWHDLIDSLFNVLPITEDRKKFIKIIDDFGNTISTIKEVRTQRETNP